MLVIDTTDGSVAFATSDTESVDVPDDLSAVTTSELPELISFRLFFVEAMEVLFL